MNIEAKIQTLDIQTESKQHKNIHHGQYAPWTYLRNTNKL